jgi:hypothetical protein
VLEVGLETGEAGATGTSGGAIVVAGRPVVALEAAALAGTG